MDLDAVREKGKIERDQNALKMGNTQRDVVESENYGT